MFLLIDNYDSFTFNLVQAFQRLGKYPEVRKNDDASVLELAESGTLSAVCLSPGPSHPGHAGYCLEFLRRLPAEVPVLGVCLGHQILGAFAGAEIRRADRIMHGKSSSIEHNGEGLFAELPNPLVVGRYHSLVVDVDGAPEDVRNRLQVTARTAGGTVMAMRYADRPWHGVQFHPESVLTPEGEKLISHFPEGIL